MAVRNLLDRAISYVSPAAGARRDLARAQGELLTDMRTRSETPQARNDRLRDEGWRPFGGGTVAEVDVDRLREISRRLCRTNPHARKARLTFVGHTVGWGIRPKSRSGLKGVDAARTKAWKAWGETRECDAEGRQTAYGLMALAASILFESGRVLVRKKVVGKGAYRTLPTKIQVLEPDYLDHSKDGAAPGGGQTIRGIEFAADGCTRIAYHIRRTRPGDNSWGALANESVRVPADEVADVHVITESGQVDALPVMHAVLGTLQDRADTTEATLIRLKLEACIGGVVEYQNELPNFTQEMANAASRGASGDVEFTPGMLLKLKYGQSFRPIQPTSAGGAPEMLRLADYATASGLGIGYDQLTSDVSQANYSSIRAARLEFNRQVELTQHLVLIPMLCASIWEWFCEGGLLAALWKDAPALADWDPPPVEMTDPLKDTSALLMQERAGYETWDRLVSGRGYDPDEQLAVIAARNMQFDALGVVRSGDPRKVSDQGQAQVVPGAEDEGDGAEPPKSAAKKTAKKPGSPGAEE
ncbi:phage portal protein [Roseomonas sp. GC11]|uniref:phage portal protein n=1 Tax=Roseomonas sp. GC11 TaxID=2950546 RepID=UPI00210C8CE7|nr:phage portal protein [Roseomonas sp. GC11]MCQ4160868.1 phage portal protein [Roseomonas sp. GC11]